MFTTQHFIWIAISVVLIVVFSILSIKFKWKRQYVLIGCVIIALLSECTKLFTNTEISQIYAGTKFDGVKYLPVNFLPLHLCSIQIFFLLYQLISKNEKTKEWLNSFMVTTMLLGAPFAIALPTCSCKFTDPTSYQVFIFHAMIIVYAIYHLGTHQVKFNLNYYLKNMAFLLALAILSIWVNSIFNGFGAIYDTAGNLVYEGVSTNFFFTSHPPAANLPYLNLNQGWEMYIIKLFALGIVLVSALHAPFLIKEYKEKKLAKAKQAIVEQETKVE